MQVKDSQLFVDANDRSLEVEMTFQFLPEQSRFVVYLSSPKGSLCDRLPARLLFDDLGRSWLGIELIEP